MMNFHFPKTALLAATLVVTAFGQAKLPQYSRETLPNGTVVLLMPRSGVPHGSSGAARESVCGRAGRASRSARQTKRSMRWY